MTIVEIQPSFIVNGTKGTFVKTPYRFTRKAISTRHHPDHPQYGTELSGSEGTLTTVSEDGTITREKIASQKSSYLNTLRKRLSNHQRRNAIFYYRKQIIQQLIILES
jgi:hypothetical protein